MYVQLDYDGIPPEADAFTRLVPVYLELASL